MVGEMEPKPGIPPSPSHLAEIEKLAKQKEARVIIVTSYEPKAAAEEFAERIGAKVALIPSDVGAENTKDWFDFQDMIVDRIVAALPAAKEPPK